MVQGKQRTVFASFDAEDPRSEACIMEALDCRHSKYQCLQFGSDDEFQDINGETLASRGRRALKQIRKAQQSERCNGKIGNQCVWCGRELSKQGYNPGCRPTVYQPTTQLNTCVVKNLVKVGALYLFMTGQCYFTQVFYNGCMKSCMMYHVHHRYHLYKGWLEAVTRSWLKVTKAPLPI